MRIKVINKSRHRLSPYSTEATAGKDLREYLDNYRVFHPQERALVPKGLYLKIPIVKEARISSRRCLAIKHGIPILNSPVTIDSDNWDNVCIIPVNLSKKNSVISDGKKICKGVVAKHERSEWVYVDDFFDIKSESCGFGHTGKEKL